MAGKDKKRNSNVSENKGKETIFWIIGAIAVCAVIIFLVFGNVFFSSSGSKKGKSFNLKGSEILPVLDPNMFTGQVREAYAAAKKYPQVMNQVFCYCFCDAEPFNHKTLLSCFTDKHGAG